LIFEILTDDYPNKLLHQGWTKKTIVYFEKVFEAFRFSRF